MNLNNNLAEIDPDRPTQLFSLPLMGQGDSSTESLTSYITRISKAHSVSVGLFVNDVLAPQLKKPYLSKMALAGGTRFYVRSRSYNGMGETARALVLLLTTLTRRPALDTATMIHFAPFISSRNLVRPTKAWCPLCLEEMARSNTLYEPLLWSLQAVKHCPKHLVPLQNLCPTCDKTIMYLQRRAEIGLCPHCGTFLGSTCRIEETVSDIELQRLSVIEQLIQRMQVPQSMLFPLNFKSHLDELVNVYCEGNAAAAARHVSVPKTTLWYWQHKNTLPTLEQAVEILNFLNGSLPLGNTRAKHLSGTDVPHNDSGEGASPTCPGLADIEVELRSTLLQPTRPSLSNVADSLGTNTKFLYKHFPALSKAITHAYQEGISLSAEARRIALVKQVQETTECLLAKGIYPSQRNVERAMCRPALLREKVLKEAWRQTVERCTQN